MDKPTVTTHVYLSILNSSFINGTALRYGGGLFARTHRSAIDVIYLTQYFQETQQKRMVVDSMFLHAFRYPKV